MIKRKSCFSCKRNYPLFLYHINTSKYMREADKGVTIECRLCTFKRAKNQSGLTQRVNGKFDFVPMSRIEIIKYCLKK